MNEWIQQYNSPDVYIFIEQVYPANGCSSFVCKCFVYNDVPKIITFDSRILFSDFANFFVPARLSKEKRNFLESRLASSLLSERPVYKFNEEN